MERTGRRGTA
ncbi:unnamed protein product [Linum tenue]|uniref:Uncharacterized protein n=1 Tax=Linum tenue TaxID=586396 RepID=A0AAV0GZR8_9ROSI|nr:unnamed protein product [Linum tenue]